MTQFAVLFAAPFLAAATVTAATSAGPAAAGGVLTTSSRPGSQGTVATTGITAVRIGGAASRIALDATTDATTGASYSARLSSGHAGWFGWLYSGWFLGRCAPGSEIWREGTVLHVHVAKQPLSMADCKVTLDATLPAGVSVSIGQAAAEVRLSGSYSKVQLTGGAVDFNLAGHVDRLDLNGTALRAGLAYTRLTGDEAIRIDAADLYARLDLPAGARISYRVKARASYVDSALPDTPGAKPVIDISGGNVMAVIR